MLAAMSTAPRPSSSQATAVSRDAGDACPGALRLHEADDGALARVRIPGGVLTVEQAVTLGEAARRLGDGELHLTSRGNVQLRGLRAGCGAELAELLGAAGLLPSPAHERVRNVVASPLSGLDGRGARDVRPWLTDLDAALCASTAAVALSGRFLFALDDGRGDVAALGADVTVRATDGDGALLSLGAARESLRVSGADAPRAAVLAAEVFLDVARARGARVWRIDELDVPAGELTVAVARGLTRSGIGCARVERDTAEERHTPRERDTAEERDTVEAAGPPPGQAGSALCVHVPFGRLTAAQWREVTRAAAGFRSGGLRLTPWRGLVVPAPDAGPGRTADVLARLSAAGLVTDAGSPWPRVGACTGRPGCARSRADVRADATRALATAGRAPLPVYWSGCERRCGHPRGDRIDVVAEPGGGYRLTTAVRGQDPRGTSLDDPSGFAAALAAILP
ncbi:precorrin-3B synthase [Streptomyces sp. bgisy022]|uniref:precorrin-3B synthase n=1 Tax=Streptomyces sp. bgisy022 TaxID=3413769 RepID=UPI003D7360FE